ncbi:VC0807 family protein [Peribacillus asahii]|uniref:Membrane protein n=1 Tax=Peribacillus asahii TaxID=228899 RepID=A0A3Q9RNJ3_9BACI|nr:membrane protein [Peribacillus asahii]
MLIVDFVLFFIFPLVFWELCREVVGDYPAMILSTLPGILYCLYRFNDTGRLNYTGICVFLNLTAGLLVDFLSGSALQLLWNNVFYSVALLFIYSVSVAARKPLYLYFTLDLMAMRGYDRKITKELFFEKKTYKLFQLITLIYCANELIYIVCLSRWIMKYGVEAYRLDIILDKSLNIMLSSASLAIFFFIHQAINEITPVKKIPIAYPRRKSLPLSSHWTSYHFERTYFYFSTHKR